MAGALNDLGVKSKSWMNWQMPIITEGEHTNARIINVGVKGVNEYLHLADKYKNLGYKNYNEKVKLFIKVAV